MINRLVVNGCSYMAAYTAGRGHYDLATELGINTAIDLSQSGCANNRMIRTTLKDSFLTTEPTLYIIGLTFISRGEAPILKLTPDDAEETSFEGRWTNPQNQMFKDRWEHFWSDEDTEQHVKLREKEEIMSILDRTEDLMYRLISLIESLQVRQHRILLYQQADIDYLKYLDTARLNLFKKYPNFLRGLNWCAVRWQHAQGVPINTGNYTSKYGNTPEEIRHRESGKHQILNNFLTTYIKENKILE